MGIKTADAIQFANNKMLKSQQSPSTEAACHLPLQTARLCACVQLAPQEPSASQEAIRTLPEEEVAEDGAQKQVLKDVRIYQEYDKEMRPLKKKNLQVGEQAGKNQSVFKDERGFCVVLSLTGKGTKRAALRWTRPGQLLGKSWICFQVYSTKYSDWVMLNRTQTKLPPKRLQLEIIIDS